MTIAATEEAARPRLRGRLHQVAFFVSLPAGGLLLWAATSPLAKVGAGVYAASLAALYGASAAYHRLPGTLRMRSVLRRVDHSMIFVLIAGSYTPLCLLLLHGSLRVAVLATVWSGAVVGVFLKVFHMDSHGRVGTALYLVLGWLAVVTLPSLVPRLHWGGMALLIAGGLLYTVGAVVLARRRPDPVPTVFGYHEVWHTMVCLAGACHFLLILGVVRGA